MIRSISFVATLISIWLLAAFPSGAARNPNIVIPTNSAKSSSILPADIETEFSVVCSVGSVSNYITNSTIDQSTGTNEWTILIGNTLLEYPSMNWNVPDVYLYNNYLYYASLRVGQGDRLVHLSTDTSPGGEYHEGSEAISDFDTHFYISDQTNLLPPQEKIGVGVHENTYAWSEVDADDFIIYEFWIVNLNYYPLTSIYAALHSDCDVSSAGGGSGLDGYWRDDLPGYYRDEIAGEYISYMYDGDNPAIPGDDEGGRFDPRESLGYIGSRLLYCPPIMGENTPSVQQGHGWWDWNSDPADETAWMQMMSDGEWLDPPPSPHDFRYLQKLGPFEIPGGDSIRVVLAFGIGNGLIGLRSNLNNAKLLYENSYVYYDLPPDAPQGFAGHSVADSIEFTWEPVLQDDLLGYNIYAAAGPEGPFVTINQSPIDTAYFLYSPSQRGCYYFYLTSEDLGGNESITTDTVVVSTLPLPPSDFRAIPGNNQVQLNWSVIEGALAYRIYRSNTSGGPYSQIAEIADPQHSYTDNDVVNYQTYYYVATTVVDGYESPYSGEIEVTPNPNLNGRVLLVDDYEERDEGGNPLRYQERRRFYQKWGVYNFDYDLWVIADQGMPDLPTLQQYQAVLFASDAAYGESDGTWWYDVGSIGGGVLRDYLEGNGRLLAVGQTILSWIYNNNPPLPGDFEYDWFGIDSVGGWDYWQDFTWAIGVEQGYPDSMKLDVARLPDQVDYATTIYSLRPETDTLFIKGLDINGQEPNDYLKPVGIIYRPGGEAKTSLINFGLSNMPGEDVHLTIDNILRDEFGCTFYEDPAPLPPWHVAVTSVVGEGLYLTWDGLDEDDIVEIKLYRSVGGNPYELFDTLEPDMNGYTDSDVLPGSIYKYKLSCVDFAGQEGDFSQEVSEIGGRPSAPIDFAAESGDEQVTLTWIAPDEPVIESFRIYRRVRIQGGFSLIATLPSSQTSYIDSDVTNKSSFYYYATSFADYDVESYPSDTLFALPHEPGRSGILVVNGIDWSTYIGELPGLYQNHCFTGSLPYLYWDLFDTIPIGDFPDPDSILGLGEFPPILFDAFQTIVWAGNNYNGDEVYWASNLPNIINFLESGGNLILPVRYGREFFNEQLTEFAGVDSTNWVISIGNFDQISTHEMLTDIVRIGSQSLVDVPMITGPYTTRLWKPSLTQYDAYASGFIAQPPGMGKFVYIAGRSYRWDHEDLRENMQIIHDYFFGQTGVDDPESRVPSQFALSQNYPNPFNPATTIRFALPLKSDVRLEIFDILGRLVNVLIDKQLGAGYHEIVWEGKNGSGGEVASGIYFYRLKAGEFNSTKKMLILK